jgi:hypothetical protein
VGVLPQQEQQLLLRTVTPQSRGAWRESEVAAQRCDQSRAAAVAPLQAAALAELLQPMLSWEPAARPTAAQLLHTAVFRA